jgi:hypothetical protein
MPLSIIEAFLENQLCERILNKIDAVRKSPDFDNPQAEMIASCFK